MADRSLRTKRHVDSDGVITTEGSRVRTGVWLLVLAMAIVGVALFMIARPAFESPGDAAPAASAPAPGTKAAALRAAAPPPRVALRATPAAGAGELSRTPRAPLVPAKSAAQPAAAEAASDEGADQGRDAPSGIAVFPPPGTKPIKAGIIVPDGVELPPGFVRHYQTTDRGEQLPPILMFSPDYHPVDEHGAPIPLPEDRVVPPEMVPEGIPLQALEVPADGTAPDGISARGRQDFDHPPNGVAPAANPP